MSPYISTSGKCFNKCFHSIFSSICWRRPTIIWPSFSRANSGNEILHARSPSDEPRTAVARPPRQCGFCDSQSSKLIWMSLQVEPPTESGSKWSFFRMQCCCFDCRAVAARLRVTRSPMMGFGLWAIWALGFKSGITPQSNNWKRWEAKRSTRKRGRSWMKSMPFDWMTPCLS